MGFNFLAEDREQSFLLPPSVVDWLPEDHLAWFVLDAVEQMDLSEFYAAYRQDGHGGAAHHPKMMVGLLLYAYCVGVRSSRQIERSCQVDVAFRVITANQFPDHTTIARFRARHEVAIKGLFTASLRLCATAGMASVGLVALDGTKIGAPASLAANATGEAIAEQVEQMLAEAASVDAAEDAQLGDARGDEPPAVLRGRASRKARFERAKALLDEQERAEQAAAQAAYDAHLAERAAEEARRGRKLRGRKPKPPSARGGSKKDEKPTKVNTSDPESKVMSTSNGFVQGYNAQAMANEEQVVLGAEVTDEQNDVAQLHPMLEATGACLHAAGVTEPLEKVLADAGYASEANLAGLSPEGPDCYIATRNMRHNRIPRTGRRGPLRKNATLLERMDRKVTNKAGRALYRRRQAIIEPVFGQIKDGRNIRRFMRRGLAAADSEWKLICGSHNLLKLYRRVLRDARVAPALA